MAKIDSNFVMNIAFPRIMKAALWGAFTFMIVYYLPMSLLPSELPTSYLPFDYQAQLLNFALISVFFAVAGQLFSKTVLGCGFGIAKAIVIVAYFLALSDGGILSLSIPVSDFTVNFVLDISTILLMLIAVNVLAVAKNLLEAINILNEKANKVDFA